MNPPTPSFFVTGGTLRPNAPSYVTRAADRELFEGLSHGEFCYVLTSRQMGKSSLMSRTAARLRETGTRVVVLDLTSYGQNLTVEQWYDGLCSAIGRQLRIEDLMEAFWMTHERLGGLQRLMMALEYVILPVLTPSAENPDGRKLVVFVDEIDVVRSLPFSTDEFFAAIRGCYNRRPEQPGFERVTFCLMGTAAPADLIRDPRTTPFHIGRRIELTDFTIEEASVLVPGIEACMPPSKACPIRALAIFDRIHYWTAGHPYLTQRLCQAVSEILPVAPESEPETLVDRLCDQIFLSTRARELDDNLLFVRERMLRGDGDPTRRICLYEEIRSGKSVRDDDSNDAIGQLRLAGIIGSEWGELTVRNRIYHTVFDPVWIETRLPFGELEKPGGERLRLMNNCMIGRGIINDLVLLDDQVSRRHAQIQMQSQGEYTLQDLGSSNGTFIDGRPVQQPVILHDGARIDIGPFQLIFRQIRKPEVNIAEGATGHFRRPPR